MSYAQQNSALQPPDTILNDSKPVIKTVPENKNAQDDFRDENGVVPARPALNIDSILNETIIDTPLIDLKETPHNTQTEVQQTKEPNVHLSATFHKSNEIPGKDLVWHIFKVQDDAEKPLKNVKKLFGGHQKLYLKPGSYIASADYGLSQNTQQFTVDDRKIADVSLSLNAGGLRLNAALNTDYYIEKDVHFKIYPPRKNEEDILKPMLENAPLNTNIALDSGIYHIVSTYGTLNAVVRADIEIKEGELTEVTLFHKAARLTLKLVNDPGGEALANTSWSILDANGDTITELIGAFPEVILAEGDYSVIARNNELLYTRDFNVQTGVNRDIELVAE